VTDARFFVAPNKPVSQMTDDELDEFATALARGTKNVAADASATKDDGQQPGEK
jgi:hypothetical protein